VSAISAAASGNVTGSGAGFVQAAAVNYLQSLGVSQVKKLADSMGSGADSDAARALLHGVVACAGATASSGNCAAGAMGAAASSVLAKLISMATGDDLSSEEREARGNLIASVVAGMSEAISVDPSTSTIAAVTELTNNALTLSQLKLFEAEASVCEAIGNCDQVQQKFRELSMEAREVMIAVCAADPTACRERFGEFVEQSTEYRKQLDKLLGMEIPSALKDDLGVYFMQNAEAASIVIHTEIAADLQKRYGVSPEVAERAILLGSMVAGAIKSPKGFGNLFEAGRTPKASELKQYAESQGWRPSQSEGGPLKYIDENGISRMTIKQGSSRAPGSADPHVELRDATGQRTDAYGNQVTRKSPGNHTPIDYDL